jgi:hypothetical protein
MVKKRQSTRIIDTPSRKRLAKEIGKGKLKEFEQLILREGDTDGVILETQARSRLRKEIGKAKLEWIESAILRGEL